MSTTGIGLLQKLNHKSLVTLSGVEYDVEILLDGKTYLRGASNSVNEIYPIIDDAGVDTGIRGLRSWRTDVPVMDKNQQNIRFILMGNLIEEITERNI